MCATIIAHVGCVLCQVAARVQPLPTAVRLVVSRVELFFLFPVEFDFRRFLFRLADARDFVSCVGVVKEWESCLQGALMDMTLAPHQ